MIKFDPTKSTPIYEQIILGVKELIIKGAIVPGDKLPSIRELASMIVINPNTISKAYGELEQEGVIHVVKGKGTYVSQDCIGINKEFKVTQITEELRKVIVEAESAGISKMEIQELIDGCYKLLKGSEYNA
ncbi:MAG: GntR family transcriptional regulator [Clostridium sp.]